MPDDDHDLGDGPPDGRLRSVEADRTVETDLTVVGGGVAGVCAAVAAARQGASVALVNDRPVLGGNSSSEVRVHLSGATGQVHDVKNRYAREGGLVEELLLRNRYENPQGNAHHWAAILEDLVAAGSRCELFLNTQVTDVETATGGAENRVTAALAEQSSTGRTLRFESQQFVDATGHGVVAVEAGAEWRQGPEAADEYGEALAPESASDETLSSTIMFKAVERDEPVPFEPPRFAHDYRDDPPELVRRYVISDAPGRGNFWWIQYGGAEGVDPYRDADDVRDELRAVVFGIWDYVKNSDDFDDETVANLDLEWVGSVPGTRESRRVVGEHVLTEGDITEQRRFPDAVGHGGWFVDLHPPGGMEEADVSATEAVHHVLEGPYGYPLRSLVPRGVDNVWLAGRCMSATRVAFGSLRVQCTLGTTGQAAGTAAAVALDRDAAPATVAADHVDSVQRRLHREDQWIPGAAEPDPRDLASAAELSASATQLPAIEMADRTVELDGDLGLHLPLESSGTVKLGVEVDAPATLGVEVFTESQPQNYVPAERIASDDYRLDPDDRWLSVDVPSAAVDGHGAFVVLSATDDVTVRAADRRLTGVLACPRDGPDPTWQPADWVPCLHLPDADLYDAGNLTDGHLRPAGRPHSWCSPPLSTLAEPPRVELRWDDPVEVGAVQVTTDTDLTPTITNLERAEHRAVPAAVRDYRIDAVGPDGGRDTIVEVSDNYQRLRRHVFDPVETKRLDLTVEATNGRECAELYEIRAYPPAPEGPFESGDER